MIQDELMSAIEAYRERFDDVPTTFGVPREKWPEMIALIKKMVELGEPLSDDSFRQALGMKPLTPDQLA